MDEALCEVAEVDVEEDEVLDDPCDAKPGRRQVRILKRNTQSPNMRVGQKNEKILPDPEAGRVKP